MRRGASDAHRPPLAPSDDALIVAARAAGQTWNAIAARLGCSRWCASEHAKAAGIYGEPRHTRAPNGETAPEPELNDDPEQPPLPAMHPVTWGAIAGGTLLEENMPG